MSRLSKYILVYNKKSDHFYENPTIESLVSISKVVSRCVELLDSNIVSYARDFQIYRDYEFSGLKNELMQEISKINAKYEKHTSVKNALYSLINQERKE